MNDEQRDLKKLEQFLQHAARDIDESIPPTPPIHLAVRGKLVRRRSRRRLLRTARVAALGFAALVVVLLLSPDVRAVVARFLGLDTVRIVPIETLPAPTASSSQSTLVQSESDIEPAGLTTLANAQLQASFDIRLPDYALGAGEPLRVYFQELETGQQLILVYPDFVLYQASRTVYLKRVLPATVLVEVAVNDTQALWMTGAPHLIQIENADGSFSVDSGRLVEGNVLAWEVGEVTYRIETTLPLAVARQIAESIGTSTQLVGLTTLSEARAKAKFDIRLPSGFDQVEQVYFQDFGGDLGSAQQVILVYPDFTLFQTTDIIYEKTVSGATIIEEVKVNDGVALWLSGGEHLVQVRASSDAPSIGFRRVERNVLAWEIDDLTFRIETDLPLLETIQIAESIEQ